MTAIWDETQFKGTDLLVLLALADHANDAGVCWPSIPTLARRARCTDRQVKRVLKHLQAEGWLLVKKRPVPSGGYGNLYKISVPTGKNCRGDICGSRGDIRGQRGDMEGKSVVTPMSPESSGEPSIESEFSYAFQPTKGGPTVEELTAHVVTASGLNAILAVSCVQRWLADRPKMEGWQGKLAAFATKYAATLQT